jgi:signal transduction histidine kinase
MAQSVSHDLRNHLTAIYSNVEFMSESRTTDVDREELLEEVRAVIQDMTGMLDTLLLLAKTGQPLHPRWGFLTKWWNMRLAWSVPTRTQEMSH